jgi:hypothetical protein
MPKDFEKCEQNGGEIRTFSGPNEKFDLKEGEYRKVCFLRGSAYWGYKEKKESDEKAEK